MAALDWMDGPNEAAVKSRVMSRAGLRADGRDAVCLLSVMEAFGLVVDVVCELSFILKSDRSTRRFEIRPCSEQDEGARISLLSRSPCDICVSD